MPSSILMQYYTDCFYCWDMQHLLLKVLLATASSHELIIFGACASLLHLLPYANVSASSPFLAYSPAFPLQCPHLHSGKLPHLHFRWEKNLEPWVTCLIMSKTKLTFSHLAHLPGRHLLQQLKGAGAQRSDVTAPLEPAVTNLSPKRVASSLSSCCEWPQASALP